MGSSLIRCVEESPYPAHASAHLQGTSAVHDNQVGRRVCIPKLWLSSIPRFCLLGSGQDRSENSSPSYRYQAGCRKHIERATATLLATQRASGTCRRVDTRREILRIPFQLKRDAIYLLIDLPNLVVFMLDSNISATDRRRTRQSIPISHKSVHPLSHTI